MLGVINSVSEELSIHSESALSLVDALSTWTEMVLNGYGTLY